MAAKKKAMSPAQKRALQQEGAMDQQRAKTGKPGPSKGEAALEKVAEPWEKGGKKR